MKNNKFQLTNKGLAAVNIHEVHSLVLADILETRLLDNLTAEELVSVLSIFTNIRLSDNDKYINIESCQVTKNIKKNVKNICDFRLS